MASKPFLGKGLHYPLQINASGDFRIDVDSLDTVKSSIIFLLHTRLGERPHRPETGTRLPDFKHETNSVAVREALVQEIKNTLLTNEPRIRDLDVGITTSAKDQRQVLLRVHYTVIGKDVAENVVFPFLLGER